MIQPECSKKVYNPQNASRDSRPIFRNAILWQTVVVFARVPYRICGLIRLDFVQSGLHKAQIAWEGLVNNWIDTNGTSKKPSYLSYVKMKVCYVALELIQNIAKIFLYTLVGFPFSVLWWTALYGAFFNSPKAKEIFSKIEGYTARSPHPFHFPETRLLLSPIFKGKETAREKEIQISDYLMMCAQPRRTLLLSNPELLDSPNEMTKLYYLINYNSKIKEQLTKAEVSGLKCNFKPILRPPGSSKTIEIVESFIKSTADLIRQFLKVRHNPSLYLQDKEPKAFIENLKNEEGASLTKIKKNLKIINQMLALIGQILGKIDDSIKKLEKIKSNMGENLPPQHISAFEKIHRKSEKVFGQELKKINHLLTELAEGKLNFESADDAKFLVFLEGAVEPLIWLAGNLESILYFNENPLKGPLSPSELENG